MPLAGSGTISLANLATEFGGAAPHSLSEYYRDGAYTPSTKTVSTFVREPSSGDYYSDTAPSYSWVDVGYGGGGGTANTSGATWNGASVFEGIATNVDSYTVGGYTYYQGSYRGYVPGGDYSKEFWYYGIYRTSGSSSTVSINTGIPSSGQISLSQFYGAEKP